MFSNVSVTDNALRPRQKIFIEDVRRSVNVGSLYGKWSGSETVNITDPLSKKDAMISFGGRELARLEKSLPNSIGEGLNEYDRLRTKLNNYFTPKRNKHYAKYQFLSMRTTAGETTAAYAARLRQNAYDYEYHRR